MATIVLDSAKVIAACKAKLELVQQKRKQEDEKTLEREMGKTYHTWYLKPYKPTREQAEKTLLSDSAANYPSIRGWGSISRCEKVLAIAELGDPVTLTDEDVSWIF